MDPDREWGMKVGQESGTIRRTLGQEERRVALCVPDAVAESLLILRQA